MRTVPCRRSVCGMAFQNENTVPERQILFRNENTVPEQKTVPEQYPVHVRSGMVLLFRNGLTTTVPERFFLTVVFVCLFRNRFVRSGTVCCVPQRCTTGNAVAEQKCDDFCSGTNVSVPEQYFRSVMVLITVFHSGTENDANCCGTV